jgi:hypothetical protein
MRSWEFRSWLKIRPKDQKESSSPMLLFQVVWIVDFADLAVGLINVLTDIIWKMTVAWYAGNIACKLVRFFQVSLIRLKIIG